MTIDFDIHRALHRRLGDIKTELGREATTTLAINPGFDFVSLERALREQKWLVSSASFDEALDQLGIKGELGDVSLSDSISSQRDGPVDIKIRYCCPLNVAQPSEQNSIEWLLEYVMSTARLSMEERQLNKAASENIIDTLALVGLWGAFSGDLRFIDALNYWFEQRCGLKSAGDKKMKRLLRFYARTIASFLIRYEDSVAR